MTCPLCVGRTAGNVVPPFANVSRVSAITAYSFWLGVRFLKLRFAATISFPKVMVRPLCEENEVKFELPVLGDALAMRER